MMWHEPRVLRPHLSSVPRRIPLGLDTHRDLKYMLDRGPFELQCVQCGARERYNDVTVWESAEAYSPALMGVSRQRVHRVSKAKP